nr:potassium-transporting ATPase subunit F [Cellulomonas uda]
MAGYLVWTLLRPERF